MAQLTFPIVPAGLALDVMVNLEASVLVPLRARGAGPAPVLGRALIDTGSDITAVGLPILQQLGITPLQQTSTRSISGSVPVDLYRVSLHILDVNGVRLPWFSHPSIVVMALPLGFPWDALIGMDIVRSCKLLVDGPASQFTVEF